ncbi:murein hydrolase activator EnvC family protein [Raoultibacter phocaeensis]|uniref:murein hydrolase activator EnvC family protein n=1 Tax=Raoultibacter phocaeensis TaxID=2479841 RepID=UPI00111996E6|nr:M23 family metallopeptidase [Raoultibacter phocaeensis]
MTHATEGRVSRALLGMMLCFSVLAGGMALSVQPAYADVDAASSSGALAVKELQASELMSSIDALQTQLNEANDEYDRATEEYERATAAAEAATTRLEEANKEVEALQEKLSECAAGMYKSGGTLSFLNVLLGAESFDDFITMWDSCEKITANEAELVQESKDARARAEKAEATLSAEKTKAEEEAVAAKAARDEIEAAKEELDGQLASVNEELVMMKATEETERLAAEEAVRRLQEADNIGGSLGTIAGWTHPCPSGPAVTNEFGWAGAWDGEYHNGIDLGASEGTPIVAAASGTVSYVGDYGSGGKAVKINHGSGLVTIYMHMSSQAASIGQQVSAGDVIGYVGSTGYSTGPHLHFQVEYNGTPVNPRLFVKF